jgi:hypothetical protein
VEGGMAKAKLNGRKQRLYWGRTLTTLGLAAGLTDLWLLAKPLFDLAARIHQGFLGLLPSLGMCVLNATNAIVLHQIDYIWFISHILVLCCAMTALLLGTTLLRRRAPRPVIIELTLSSEWEGRETINNGSR